MSIGKSNGRSGCESSSLTDSHKDHDIAPEISQKKRTLPSLKFNAAGNWLVLCVNILIGFFLTPAIFRHLDQKNFGIWMLASSVIGYFGLLKFGIGTAVCRYVPLYRGQQDQNRVSIAVSTAMAIYVSIGFFIFVASWCFASAISNFFDAGHEFIWLIRMIGLAAALQFPYEIFDAAIRGYERFIYANMVEIISAVLRAVILGGCILLDYGLIPMGCSLAIVAAATLAAGGFAFRKCCKDIKLDIRLIKISECKIILYFALTMSLCALAELLTYESPKQIIGKVISLEAVGVFAVFTLLVSYYRRAVYALTRVFMPRFSYLSGSGAVSEVKRLFLKGSRYTAIFSAAIALGLWTIGPSFIHLWLNKNFGQAINALTILTAGTFMLVSFRMSVDLMYGLGKQLYVSIIDISEGIGVFILTVVLAGKYGLIGTAIGFALPIILIRSFAQIFVSRLIKIGYWKYCAICFIKPLVITVLLVGAYHAAGIAGFITSWARLFLISAAVILVYGIIIYLTALEKEEKEQISKFTGFYFGQERYLKRQYQ